MNTATDPFFEDEVEAEIDSEALKRQAKSFRTRLAGWLSAKGLSTEEVELVLLKLISGGSLRRIATEVGLSKSKVERILRSPHIRQATEETRSILSRRALPPANEAVPTHEPRVSGRTLREIREWALHELSPSSEEFAETQLREWSTSRKSGSPWLRNLELAFSYDLDYSHLQPTPRDVSQVVRFLPGLLLCDKGRPALELLVDLLEAARFGASGHRRLPRSEAHSRADLQRLGFALIEELGKRSKGNAYSFSSMAYGWVVYAYACRIRDLQLEWKKSLGQTRRGRLDRFRKAFPHDAEGVSDQRLLSILTGEIVSSASQLAESHIGISAELLAKGYRKRFRNFDISLSSVPSAAITPPG